MREWHIGKLIRKLWGLGLSAVPELVISTIAGSRIRQTPRILRFPGS